MVCELVGNCNPDGQCDTPDVQYCDQVQLPDGVGQEVDPSSVYCQALYFLDGTTLSLAHSSCFHGELECRSDEECVLEVLPGEDEYTYYHCCCQSNLCNVSPVLPNYTDFTSTPTGKSCLMKYLHIIM